MTTSRLVLRRPHVVPLAAAVVGAATTALVALAPFLGFAYHNPSLRLIVETSAALVALLAAYLVVGRFRHTRLQSDLALGYALALLGVTNVGVSIMAAWSNAAPEDVRTWAALACRLLAAIAFAAAAAVPPVKVARPRGAGLFVTTAAVATVSVASAAVAAFAGVLPELPVVAPDTTLGPLLTDERRVLSTQLVVALLYGVAAVGFGRQIARSRDAFTPWLSAGAALAAFSSLHYFLYPSFVTSWVYTGDFLRLGFYALLLTGAAHEIRSYWRSRADAAVLEERRRLARDLHDGLAQELAYIARQAHELADEAGSRAANLARASERALDESRRAIAILTRPLDRPFAAQLAETVAVAGARVGARVHLDMSDDVAVPAEARDDLLRIASEAITNAGRHGRAREIDVACSNGDGTLLRIADSGVGFEPAAAEGRGFGIPSMRERAESHAGVLEIRSRPGAGTEVEVRLP